LNIGEWFNLNKHNNIEVNVTENKAKGGMIIQQHVFILFFLKRK
jgi:hypothetical protein